MATPIALRGSAGIWLVNGPPQLGTNAPFMDEKSDKCKVMVFSKDGSLFAWNNGTNVKIYNTSSNQLLQEVDRPRASCMAFSPKGTLFVIWEPYTVDQTTQQGVPNLNFFSVATGECLKSLIQKKVSYWAPQFSDDEKLSCRNVNNELHFFEDCNFNEIKTKLHLQKVAGYSLSAGGPPYMVAGYVPGGKGQPSFVRMYKYPNFGGPNAAVANRTFFKADKVEMLWNKASTGMLLLTTTDTSESSYYGDQGLHYLGTNGESNLVHLGKNGPVYHIEWSPKSTEFCVVYGFMPAKATIYNLKTEPVFDFGTGPRNFSFYNPQGNILCLCGFGNLRGNMEFWDIKQKKMIAQTQSPDTTSFQWSPDGEHILTATTSPRLRVGNGYRIWHYTGVKLEEIFVKGQELWEAFWQPAPQGKFPEKPIVYRQVQSSLPEATPAPQPQAYVPPSMRGKTNTQSTKLHEYELPSNMKQQAVADPNKPKSKNQKKKEAKKNREQGQGREDGGGLTEAPPQAAASQSNPQPSTGDPEKDKKIRNLRKKIQAIEKLKEQQAAGKQLEKNQLEKIKTEDALLKEMKALALS